MSWGCLKSKTCGIMPLHFTKKERNNKKNILENVMKNWLTTRALNKLKPSWIQKLKVQDCLVNFILNMNRAWAYHQNRLHVQAWFIILSNKPKLVHELLD